MAEGTRLWQPVALPPGQPQPVGAYSPVVRAGDFLFVSGQVPRDPVSGELLGDNVASQTRAVVRNVARVLGYAGATLDDIVSVNAYLARIEDWDTFNTVYREVMHAPFPARTTVAPGLHNCLVELTVIAYRPAT